MRLYVAQVIAVVTPAGFSVAEVISGGNLLLATVAALLAVLAGRWALRKQHTEAESAELHKQIAELQLQRELDRQRTAPPFQPTDDLCP